MSTLISATVAGIPGTIKVNSEYTNSAVLDAWANSTSGFFTIVNQIFQKQKTLVTNSDGTVTAVTTNPITTTDAMNLLSALKDIQNVAVNGITVGGKTYYLTYEMAQSLDQITKSLQIVGFDFTADPTNAGDPKNAANATALSYWVDLDSAGLRSIVLQAGQAVSDSRSLQAMIELEYVRAGNDLISAQMQTLTDAMDTTQQAMDILTRAQNLKNKLTPNISNAAGITSLDDLQGRLNLFTAEVPTSGVQTRLTASPGAPVQHATIGGPPRVTFMLDGAGVAIPSTVHTTFAPATINVQTGVALSSPAGSTFDSYKSGDAAPSSGSTVTYSTFVDYFKSKFNHVFGTLIGVTVNDSDIAEFNSIKQDLQKVISTLQQQAGGTIQPGSLADNLQKVLNDMNTGTGLPNWLLDGYAGGSFTQSGDMQRTLTAAITASESLNDSQKQDLQRFMYVFEEFYKSASALLQGINDIITKMAQGIKGG